MLLTEAEQNRLIQDNMGMVAKIAADYRGRKGIPFEEMEAEGMVGLVKAARMWEQRAAFTTYATDKIRSAIVDFIDGWEKFVPIDDLKPDEEKFYQWQIWGDFPSEGWTSLAASPEEMAEAWEAIAHKTAALEAAFLSLKPRERKMVIAHFIRKPAVPLEQVARDHEVSYKRAVKITYDAVRKLREVIKKIESSRSSPAHASKRIAETRRTLKSSGYSLGRGAGAPIEGAKKH
jgi:RNA polymerase sigma factor (sigma-70 family)